MAIAAAIAAIAVAVGRTCHDEICGQSINQSIKRPKKEFL
jgi:hypothetical protein